MTSPSYRLFFTELLRFIALHSSICIITSVTIMGCSPHLPDTYKFKLEKPPHDADPVAYDYFTHHAVFRSVLSGLVSQYRNGGYTGLLASTWSSSDNFKRWTFVVRKDLKFSNGDPILPKDIVRSWARLQFILRQKKSHSEFFDSLPKGPTSSHLSESLRGVEIDNDRIIISLEKPIEHLLEILSFGMYSVVHQNDYDPKNGQWKNPKNVTSSHAYKIIEWSDEKLILERRTDFDLPEFNRKPLKKVEYRWNPTDNLGDFQMIYGPSTAQFPKAFTFLGSVPSYMAYVYCVPFKTEASPCSNESFRNWLKSVSLLELKKRNPNFFPSFFPPSMKGTVPFPISEPTPPKGASIPHVKVSARTNVNPLIDDYLKILSSNLHNAGMRMESVPFDYDQFDSIVDSKHTKRPFDLFITYTGILVEHPTHDIKFMFRSKEGVRLPDLDGSIGKEIEKEPISVQAVNEIIWRQNLVWPIGHFSLGTWFSDGIDYSQLNSTQPPIELVWLGQK